MSAGGSVPNAAIGYDSLFVDFFSARRTYQRWVSGKQIFPRSRRPSDHHVVRPETRQPAPVFREVGSESVEVHLGKDYEALKQDHDDAAENFRAALKVDPTLVMCARFPLATALSNCAASPKRATNWKRFAARWTSDPASATTSAGWNRRSRTIRAQSPIGTRRLRSHPPTLGFAYLKEESDQDAEKWLKEAAKRNPEDSRAEY